MHLHRSSCRITLFVLSCFVLPPAFCAGQNPPNGISVGKPKVFDNRTLTIMLESLSQTLQSMQSQFVSQSALANAFANLQGFRSTETTSNLSVTTLPIPGVTQETVKNTGNVNTSGKALPDTTKTTTTTTQNAYTPQAPPLDTLPAFSGFTPTYGQSPSDLLADQVNLTYQIFNLRMLLERSLSDRLLGSQPRRQAILGFNITIDPPRTANDAVAVIEIRLAAPTGDLSLVALMPQEKTYNSAALSTKSRSFGGSAVVKMIQVGYSERRRGQTFYLYRDNDTISYERMDSSAPNQVVFGWMFRPVLGRRSVSPGLRQLFAILALPASDGCSAADAQQDQCPDLPLNAHVRTFWKKYDRNTLTSFESRDANRAARFKYAATLTLARPELLESRYTNEANYADIKVKSTAAYQKILGPTLRSVTWVPTGPKTALVSATGSNIFAGTQVSLGDKTYTGNGDGLVLKSSLAFDLATTLDALSSGAAALSGRYGPAIPLVVTDDAHDKGIEIDSSNIGPLLSGVHTLEIYLKARNSRDPTYSLIVSDLPQNQSGATPLISVNGNTVLLPYLITEVTDRVCVTERTCTGPEEVERKRVLVRGTFPDSFLAGGNQIIKVSWPFLSSRWTDIQHFSDPAAAYQVVRLSDKSLMVLSKAPAGFTKNLRDPKQELPSTKCWHLFAGDKPVTLKTRICTGGDAESEGAGDNAIAVTLKTSVPDKVVLVDPFGASFPLDIPKATSSDSSGPKSIALNQYDSLWIEIALDDVSKANVVEANQQQFKFVPKPADKPGSPSKAIRVEITRDLTSKPGNVDVTVLNKDGKSIGSVRLQIARSNCKADGGK